MRRVALLLAAYGLSFGAAAKDGPPTVLTKVEPDWGSLTSGYLIERREVEMVIAENGKPYSISAKGSVPDPVIRSLAQWRFKSGNFMVPVMVAVRIPLTPSVEQAQSPKWYPTAPLREAIKKASDFDAAQAAQLLANLPNGEEPDNPRAALLSYYARNGSADPEAARKARRELTLWLVRTYPQDAILGSSYAIVNAAGEPLADSEGSAQIKGEWLNALKQYPDDNAVAQGAANFLRLTDPMVVLRIVSARHGWDKQGSWLGSIAAFGALGVTALAPDTGTALVTSGGDSTAPFRKALLESPDLKVVLSGMATTANIARDLASHNALPSDYADYCATLLKHTHELYPQTSLTCDTTPLPAPRPTIGSQRIGGGVMEASLIKKVQPVYPREAKDNRIQGTVEFTATIGLDGHIQSLQLVKGPLALYAAAYDAVMQWEYRPTMLNGNPVTVITDVIVNFTMSR